MPSLLSDQEVPYVPDPRPKKQRRNGRIYWLTASSELRHRAEELPEQDRV